MIKSDEPLSHVAMQSLNTHQGAWSNRAGLWPLSDRRLIFSSKKEEVTEQWIQNLLVVMKEHEEPAEDEGEGDNQAEPAVDGEEYQD